MDYLDYEEYFREDTYFSEQMECFFDEMQEFKDLSGIFPDSEGISSLHQDWLSLSKKIFKKKCFKDSECLQMLYTQSILNVLESEEDFETAMELSGSITELAFFRSSERLQVQYAISLMRCLELSYDSNENIILEKLREIPGFITSKNIHFLYGDALNILINRTPLIREKLIFSESYPLIPGYTENNELQRLFAEALMGIASMAASPPEGKRIALLIKEIPGYGKVDDITDFYCRALIQLLSLKNPDGVNEELVDEIFSFPGFNENEMLQHDMVDRMSKSIDENTKPEDILRILRTARRLTLLNEVEVIHLQYLDLLNCYNIALARKNMMGEDEWQSLLETYDTAIDLPAIYPYETSNVVVKFLGLFKSLRDRNINKPGFQFFRDTIEKWLKNAHEKDDKLKLRMMGAGISYIRIVFPHENQKEIEKLTDKYCSEHQELFNNIDSLWNSFVNMNP